jgi:predicted HTH domain antitoxin
MKDKDKGVVLPLPQKETKVIFNEQRGASLGFCISVKQEEYITVSQAAQIVGCSKSEMKILVEEKKLTKFAPTEFRYLLVKSEIEALIHKRI